MPEPSQSTTNSRRKKQATALLVVASFLAAQLCFLLLPKVFEPWNAQLVDQLFVFRYGTDRFRPSYNGAVVHVDINNTSIQKLNNFYLNRSHYAQVVQNLAAMNTSAQVYDLIFAARLNESDDKALIEATRQAGNVYFGMAFILSQNETDRQDDGVRADPLRYLNATKWRVNVAGESSGFYTGSNPLLTFPDLTSASRGLGFLNIRQDRDGIYRRVPLLIRYDGAYYPSLPFKVACDYLGVTPDRVILKPGRSVTLKDALPPGRDAHDIIIPIDHQGNMIINFIGPWGCMKHYNFADVYHASEDRDELELWKEELAGKIVLISDVATGSADLGPAPTDVNFPLGGLHTNVIHTILSEDFMLELSGPEMLLLELVLLFAVLVLSIRFSSSAFSLSATAVGATYVLTAAILFLYGNVIVHIVRPFFFVTFATVLVTAYRYLIEEKEKAVLKQTFEAYFPPSIIRKIIANPEKISGKGEKKELSILFSDIENFTKHSAALTPHQIQRYLNEYFEAMVEIVFSYEGTVDKYIGDGLMVFFGDPDPQPDHALRSVRAAIQMQRKVKELRDKWEKEGGIPVRIRIGINTGEVVVGNMGSRRRLSYTVLGSAVNLAQRLETQAPVGGILISQRTYDLVKNDVSTLPLGQVDLKGIDGQVSVYEVVVNTVSSGRTLLGK